MKIKIDKDAGAAYIYLINNADAVSKPVKSEPVNENIILDYSEDGKLFGIEILNLNLLDLTNLPAEDGMES
jgi:uncharacterized protein YuzE